MFKSSTRAEVFPFQAMEVMQAANKMEAQGKRVIHMEIGEPGAPVPEKVREAALQALKVPKFSYTEAMGIAPLKSGICDLYRRRYGVQVAPEQVMITTGSSAAFNLIFLSAFEVGDKVALTSPGYPAYRNILKSLGLEGVELEVDESTRWSLSAAQLRKAHAEHGLKGVLLASPANPTGTMMTPEALKEICEVCEELGLWFISDEIYQGLSFAAGEETALKFSKNAIIINSFSKYYCMTGWRIGWMVLPQVLCRPVEKVAQSLYISAPHLSQIAATAALGCEEEYDTIKAGYARNRALLLEVFPRLGLGKTLPVDGAFYIYVDVSELSDDSMAFCKEMLDKAGVAATPGIDFDLQRGHKFVRFSFAGSYEDMQEACQRLEAWLG
ncbi:pyridoxal phosphate-dependent aminotransferase [Polycladidibacter hongkongensis]|uniref:pyridoxal phosphate-dependent aminotransferase n=1 Tax=Polycladidibacter hongkongensis TaxID=1647556 RepID=UPI000829F813|nr:aminotransferase class I/II-fold pyridoxal phosphate-dependent enzyme [Pseudovibrio hongkongensis]